jgi:hypothetical protein
MVVYTNSSVSTVQLRCLKENVTAKFQLAACLLTVCFSCSCMHRARNHGNIPLNTRYTRMKTSTTMTSEAAPSLPSTTTQRKPSCCVCNWGEDCKRFVSFFVQQKEAGKTEELRGDAAPIRLNLADTDVSEFGREEAKGWRNCVVKSLSAANIEDLKWVSVARHHWTLKQLAYFKASNNRVSTPFPYDEIKDLVHVLDSSFSTQKGKEVLYFQTPNVTRDELERQRRLQGAMDDVDNLRTAHATEKHEWETKLKGMTTKLQTEQKKRKIAEENKQDYQKPSRKQKRQPDGDNQPPSKQPSQADDAITGGDREMKSREKIGMLSFAAKTTSEYQKNLDSAYKSLIVDACNAITQRKELRDKWLSENVVVQLIKLRYEFSEYEFSVQTFNEATLNANSLITSQGSINTTGQFRIRRQGKPKTETLDNDIGSTFYYFGDTFGPLPYVNVPDLEKKRKLCHQFHQQIQKSSKALLTKSAQGREKRDSPCDAVDASFSLLKKRRKSSITLI